MALATDQNFPAEEILAAVKDLRFGVVEVHVHESNVTEIRQIRRTRFQRAPHPKQAAPEQGDPEA